MMRFQCLHLRYYFSCVILTRGTIKYDEAKCTRLAHNFVLQFLIDI